MKVEQDESKETAVLPKLPKVFKRKWLKALRSDKFTQAKHSLLKRNRVDSGLMYCCLGVACVVAGTPDSTMEQYRTESQCYIPLTNKHVPKLLRYVPTKSARNFILHVTGKLANMNDDGKSFKEIADWIEENL